MRFKLFLAVILMASSLLYSHPASAEKEQSEEEVTSFLTELFARRAKLLIDQQPETLSAYYLEDARPSVYALQKEIRRSKYLNTWADKRKLTLIEAKDQVRIVRIKQMGDKARVSLIDSLQLTYSYPNKITHAQSFGLGTRHTLTLKHTDEGWHVLHEWYLDPFDVEDELVPDGSLVKEGVNLQQKLPHAAASNSKKYDRLKAVAYAQKYAGAAWGAGNNNRYNPKYRDYTYTGGDCTNFASQVIGDPEGGGLPKRSVWKYHPQGGTLGWVRTDSFKDFLFHSGYARLLARGYYEKVIKSSALAQLQAGDLIAYEIGHHNVDHFAVIVGFDANGYPLVNCHTADRYAMPFDLGWDKHTKYLFIHMND